MKKLVLSTLALVLGAAPVWGADVPDLIKKLKSVDSDMRRAAARELADAGPEAKAAVPALRSALKDRDRFVRRFSALALAAIGPEAAGAVPDLSRASRDASKEVGEAAVTALGKIGPPALKALMDVARDSTHETVVRRKAIEGIGSMGEKARSALPVLTGLIKAGKGKGMMKGRKIDPADLRGDVALALGSIANAEDKDVLEALEALGAMKTRDKILRNNVRQALNQIKRRKAKD